MDVEVNTDPGAEELGAIAGAVLAVVAAFLPWVRVDVGVGPAEAGGATGIEGLGLLTLVLGVAVALLIVAIQADWLGIGVVVSGAAIGLLALFQLLDLGGATAAGSGIYLTIVAGTVVAVSGWRVHATDDGGVGS